jgi:drug/metabolite transporter (DMT)-like permease
MAYILVAIFLWSFLGIIIRLSDAPILNLIFGSCLVSSLLTGPLFLKRGYRQEIPKGKGLFLFLIIGPLSLINTFSFFYAYKQTSIANAVLTHYTAPIFVAFIAPFMLHERLTGKTAIAITIATAGLWILLGASSDRLLNSVTAENRETAGILAGLLSGFSYGLLIIAVRIFARTYHPLVMTFIQNIVIVLILLPFIEGAGNYLSWLWAILIMGSIQSTVAPLLYFRGMREVTAQRAAILGYLEPFSAIILGILFLHERMSAHVLLGGSMILLSGYLTLKDPI